MLFLCCFCAKNAEFDSGGMHALAYVSDDGGRVIIAFRGTPFFMKNDGFCIQIDEF